VNVHRTEAGTSWAELAQLDPLAAVLDPADKAGGKNRLIDRVHKRALARELGNVSGTKALDFGCGTGRLSAWLAARGADVDGVDLTPEMLAVARARVPEARFQTIDGSTLPFADNEFDLVITAYVLQYYVDGDGAIPRELARVLRSGGRLFAVEQVTDSDLGRGGSFDAYRQMLVAAGFEDVGGSVVRVSDSRFIHAAQRWPPLSRLRITPWLVTREAVRKGREPLAGGRYADVLFHAVKR
jgi:SAM-dependent methyltransferase